MTSVYMYVLPVAISYVCSVFMFCDPYNNMEGIAKNFVNTENYITKCKGE